MEGELNLLFKDLYQQTVYISNTKIQCRLETAHGGSCGGYDAVFLQSWILTRTFVTGRISVCTWVGERVS